MGLLQRAYEAVTGHPYWTTRSMAAEFGPPIGARYATELAKYTDMELLRHGDEIVAALLRRPGIAELHGDCAGRLEPVTLPVLSRAGQ